MARRENQGMQIAMIIFIITTLIFMLTTYLAYSSMTRLAGENEDLKSQKSTSDNAARAAEQLAASLKQSIGLDPAMADAEVTQQVEQAVSNNSIAEENQTFLGIIDELNKRITDLSGNLARANQDIQQLRQEKQDAIMVEQQKLAVARENEAKAQADFNLATKDKADYFAENKSRNDQYVAAANRAKTERDQAVQTADKRVSEAERRVAIQQDLIKDKVEQLKKYQSDTPDQYDGRILGVVAATKTVLIDRGRADGLRPKMVFGVYDAEDTNVRTAKKKASIEITNLLGDHRAQARITQIDHVNPVVTDDFIASPAWSPGETLGIALVGEMDIDDDGLDDREYVRNLIRLGGGRIDAESTPSGTTGSVSVNTRYIVVGQGNIEKEAKDLLQQADEMSVERMSISEFLDLMGYAGRSRAVTYDGVLRPGDFAPKPSARRSQPASTQFRPRAPLPRRSQPRS